MKYEKGYAEVLLFSNEDVITTSQCNKKSGSGSCHGSSKGGKALNSDEDTWSN